MRGHAKLRDAIRATAREQTHKHQNARRGTIVSLHPLTVQVHGYEHPITEDDDFETSQWMKLYHAIAGIEVGDLVLLDQDDVDWVLHDIVSDKNVSSAAYTWRKP